MKKKTAALLGAMMAVSMLMGCAIPANPADSTAQASTPQNIAANSSTIVYEQMGSAKNKAATGKMISGEISAIVNGTVTLRLFDVPAQGKAPAKSAKPKAQKTARPSTRPGKSPKASPKTSPLPHAKGEQTQKYSGEVASITIPTSTSIMLESGSKVGSKETAIDVSALKIGWTLQVFYNQDGATISKIIARQPIAVGTNS